MNSNLCVKTEVDKRGLCRLRANFVWSIDSHGGEVLA